VEVAAAVENLKVTQHQRDERRCHMYALLAVLFLVSFAGGGGGKAGW
jgi:hypothetical protein